MERVEFKDIIQTWLNGRRDAMRQEYNSSGRKASGYFGEHIDIEMYDEGGRMRTPLYVGALVFGRKPTSGGGGDKSLYSMILDWIKVKGITPDDPKMTDNTLAYLITRKIHKQGIKVPNQFNDGKLIDNTFTAESVQDLKSELMKIGQKVVTNDFKNIWQR
jgi:hypothetical protein